MTGSCDTGTEHWSFLGVTGYGAMVEFTEVHQSCFPASVLNLKRWPDLCHLHIINTGCPVVPLLCPSCYFLLQRL